MPSRWRYFLEGETGVLSSFVGAQFANTRVCLSMELIGKLLEMAVLAEGLRLLQHVVNNTIPNGIVFEEYKVTMQAPLTVGWLMGPQIS